MESENISILSWNRFRSRFLYIAPEIVGKSHEFTYDGHLVTISLPSLDKLTPREDLTKLEDHEQVLLCYNSWKEENGVENPIAYWVGYVNVTINISDVINVPSGILNHPPNAYDLLSEERQNNFNEIAGYQVKIAERAFEYWLKVIRWQSDNSLIGRPEVRGFESGWSTYLIEKDTRKRIWIGIETIVVEKEKFVTIQDWNNTSKLLKQGVHSPIYVDYYFDALEHFRLEDWGRCVIDLAVSCEALMRGFVVSNLPSDQSKSIVNYIDQANIHNYIDKFVSDFLDPVKKKSFDNLKKDLKDLFTARNAIAHGGKLNSLSSKDCQRFIKVIRNLIDLILQL